MALLWAAAAAAAARAERCLVGSPVRQQQVRPLLLVLVLLVMLTLQQLGQAAVVTL
jgi:hypothetical protein